MPHSAAGYGLIELEQVAGRTAVTQCRSNSPLKLLTPRSPGGNAWIFSGTYGGGLVDGDSIDLQVHSGCDTRCLLTTQASTKIYRCEAIGCRQALQVRADMNAIVASIPDPIVCYAGARFEQRQRFELSRDSGLVMLDWFTAGRKAHGERWAFRRYLSQTEVFVEQKCVFRDALLLDRADGPIGGDMRMGRVDCFATAVVCGLPFQKVTEKALQGVASQPSPGATGLIFSASAIPGGVVVRVGGNDVETVGRWLSRLLNGVEDVLGQSLWMRKA